LKNWDSQERSAITPQFTLNLASTAGDLPQLEQALLKMTADNPPNRTMLTSTYYDTASGSLDHDGLALQVRKQKGRYTQIVARTDVKAEEPFAREWEDVIAGERPDLRAPNSSAHLPRALDQAELRARFTTTVERTSCMLNPDTSTEILGAVDKGEIRTVEGEHTEPIYEIELQLKRGDPAALYGTGLRLLEIAPLRIELRSKPERGCRLLESTTAKPQAQHSFPLVLEPGMTVEESLRKIGLGGLRLFLRNELAALAGVSDGVHQMRVAVRRLRSAVATMKRMLPQEQYEWVSQELRWLANILAAARNWDVLSSSLLTPVRSVLPNDQDLVELCCICERERQSAYKNADAAVRSRQYTAALLKLSLWFASCSWRNQPVSEQSALLMAPIDAVAPSLIGRRYKKVKKGADRFDELTPQQRHEFRIAVKKLRYTVEFLKDLFDSNRVVSFLQRLKPLQDDVGYTNDVRVAHKLLADLQVSKDAVPVARAAGIVLGWHDRGLADHDRKLRKHIGRLRELRPFW
jgi:inorganic triphosphatase YgiF